ncbi:hypothetical protein SPRG_06795 [Saprolegnia parasitica CBS 223.65]|uniref:Uncharacterized protein n=1 Tax=Saprolegnia parasitica (strain CBS 223.65) TaxID=695850 RepID=A0A067CAJ4_SAPPC|nr:hypothetical protein SPRG_06795 [Saprolegnia parasitica CBS 223.65]KDO27528.1 hypothetical protein SPRG_06795 [Saprolegnia parasitica CBS 223.65]|eukprot:XP_012201655.1 hypothetical protein SPRG_06795 [Saprolegnia parasitica CBS 223.65]
MATTSFLAAALDGDPSSDSDYVAGDDLSSSESSSAGSGLEDEPKSDDEYMTQNTKVVQLVNYACCAKRCIFGRTEEMDLFISSLDEMSKELRHACILTSLSISISMERKRKSRSKGVRARYTYVMPYLGAVCKQAFEACFEISTGSLNKLRKQVSTSIVPKKHGNLSNQNAKAIDYDALRDWLTATATSIGAPLSVRRKSRTKDDDGVVHVQYRTDIVYVLPSTMTYEKLHAEYLAHLGPQPTRVPSEKSFRQFIKSSCPHLRMAADAKHSSKKKPPL